MPSRLLLFVVALIAAPACSSDADTPLEPGIIVGDVALPVVGAAYRGTSAHVFLDEQVTLFCGTHGSFSASVAPPAAPGGSVLSEYTATFVGEVVLGPPIVPTASTYPISVSARMAESITLRASSGDTRSFDTELVTFELQGTVMPEGIMFRESPDRASAGVTTITALPTGQSRVETYYDVWLDVSIDGGRAWQPAESAVRMTLEPS